MSLDVIGLVFSLLIQATILVLRLFVALIVLLLQLVAFIVTRTARLLAAGWARLNGRQPARQPIDPDLRWVVFRRDGYACLYCGSKTNLSIDHIYPVSRGGGNHPDNLQTLCRRCNSRKGTFV